MSEDIENAPLAPREEPKPSAHADRANARRGGGSGAVWIVALLALAAAGVALWRAYAIEHAQADVQAGMRNQLSARIDDLARSADQRKRDFDSLRARVTDADGINKSVREEVLGLGERSRHLEDAVANLVEQRLSGRDALALNEAEFLLQQAQERLALFNDAQAAISAYRLADSALAAAEDPVFASVRQTVGSELHALEAGKPIETQGAIAALERVRAALPDLPTERALSSTAAPPSRWQGFLSQFMRISRSGDADAGNGRDIGLIRALVAVDLRSAEAALLARDAQACKAALARARSGIVAGFDAQSAPAKTALAELDRIAGQSFAPALPVLGSALKELRNLRATRALARPPIATPVQTPRDDVAPGAAARKPGEAGA
jgi:uroporphyrin-3 C-methyltransferase